MKPIDIFIRYSSFNEQLNKVATLSLTDKLIYNDEGGDFKAHLKTSLKFALLTGASPLISITRLIRSVAFLGNGAGHEFIGALATPVVTTGCLIGSLLSSAIYVISGGNASFYRSMRRTYASFEAFINKIDLNSQLPSYSQRVSGPMDGFKGRVWTTAPCMQPLLENGLSFQGGLFDKVRMQKIFPFIKVNDVVLEGNKIVIQSEYDDQNVHYIGCDGAFDHRKITSCCCCFRVEATYDRILCCEVGQGSCTSMFNEGDSCGIVSCGCCGIGACCCYTQENHEVTSLNTGCFGPEGLSCITGLQKIYA
jgi:hypothetical protein